MNTVQNGAAHSQQPPTNSYNTARIIHSTTAIDLPSSPLVAAESLQSSTMTSSYVSTSYVSRTPPMSKTYSQASDFSDSSGSSYSSLQKAPSALLYQNAGHQQAIWTICSAVIGGGILALPYAMNQLGIITAVVVFIVIAVLNVYTLELLCECGRMIRATDPIFNDSLLTFTVVAEKAYPNSKAWKNFVLVSIFLMCYMTVLGYFVALSDIIPGIIENFREVPANTDFVGGRMFSAMMVLVVAYPLSLVRSISKLWQLSLFAFLAMVVLVVAVVIRGFERISMDGYPDVDNPKGAGPIKLANWDLDFLSGLSVIIFSYISQAHILPIFSELKPSIAADPKQTVKFEAISMFIIWAMYVVIALFGYLNFRDAVKDNITQSYPATDMAMLVGRIGLSIMLIMSIVLLGYPARRMMLILIRGNPDDAPTWLEASVSAFVVGTTFGLSLGFQQIGQIWSLGGAMSGSFISFIFPLIFWLKLVKHNNFFGDREAKCASALLAVSFCFMVLGTEEAIRAFVDDPPHF